MHNAIAEKLNENPVIAAVAEPQRLPAALASDCGVVFLLSGDILSIGALVDAVKNAGKAAMVHLELIEGLSGKEIAVDAIHALTRADGIISPVQRRSSARASLDLPPSSAAFFWIPVPSAACRHRPRRGSRIMLRSCPA